MTQENKELLLKDLCARLPYEVKCSFGVDDAVYEITGINPTCHGASEIQATHIKSGINGDFTLNSCKPYLFPLSSMTEEQYNSLQELGILDNCSHSYEYVNPYIHGVSFIFKEFKTYSLKLIEWLNKNHFDYRGLIPMGLAIYCTNLKIY